MNVARYACRATVTGRNAATAEKGQPGTCIQHARSRLSNHQRLMPSRRAQTRPSISLRHGTPAVFFIVIRLPASSATRFVTCPCRLARKSVGANKRPLTELKEIPPRESPPRSGFYQMFRRFSLGMYRESFSVILKASYHASMCGKAPFTRHSPSECGSLLVRLRISSSRMLAAHTLA